MFFFVKVKWNEFINHAVTQIDGLVQEYSISIANALEILLSGTKQSMAAG